MRTLRVSLGTLVLAAAPLGAQVQLPDPATVPAITVDAHWLAYLGCWDTVADGMRGPMTCLLSTSDPRIIELSTISGDSAVVRERYDLTGTPVPYNHDGCTGTQVTGWSLNERSFHVRTALTCGGGEPQVTTSVFTMRTEASFVRLQAMKVRGTTAVRVIEHRIAADMRAVRLDVLNRVPNRDEAVVRNARSTALAAFTAEDVLDASRTLEPALLEALIAAHGQKVLFGARDLRLLSSAGVPERVLDMMVAVSRPERFTLSAAGEPEVRQRQVAVGASQRPGSTALFSTFGVADCLGYGSMYLGSTCGRGFSVYDSCYGNGLYQGYSSIYPYALGGSSGAFCNDLYRYQRTFVVGYPSTWVGGGTPSTTPPTQPGRVVNGSGYSQGSATADGRGPARPVVPVSSIGSTSASVDRGGYSSPSSGSSSAGSSGASSAGAAPRTAKERP